MGWKQNNFAESKYKEKLEKIRNTLQDFRDKMIEEELKKLEHLKQTIMKANEHRAKNDVDT